MAEGGARQDGTSDADLDTDLSRGLTLREVRRRLDAYGPNEVPERRQSRLLRFARRFWGPTPWMLELTAVLTWWLGNPVDTTVVLSLLLLNGILGFAQEQRASDAVSFLRRKLQVKARVLRDGSWALVGANGLVPGDVVRLRAGDFAPADVRVREGELEVDQSALTGESQPVPKRAGDVLVSGSTVTLGETTGIVTATGARTFYGRTVELVQFARPRLHMEEVISNVAKWLIAMVSVLLALAVAVSFFRGSDGVSILPLAVVLLLSSLPVALPTMFTISTALGSLDLAGKGVLVTRLSAGEDAATLDVLCVDKTGTLTQNRLAVTEVLPRVGFSEADVLQYAALASQDANQDPIDLAILAAAKEGGPAPERFHLRSFVPFSAASRRTQATADVDGHTVLVQKGAVAAVVPPSMPHEEASIIAREVDRLSAKGWRSLAVTVQTDGAEPRLVGLLALSDPPRPDSSARVAELRRLGIEVKMLTGDALPIAREMAQSVSLGDGIARIGDLRADLRAGGGIAPVEAATGFAEIYPEDKYLVVKALQDHGHIVGMTGDGVNDAPALKQAEVGIAVSNATDVAKKAASVVLTQEGLAGIVDLVKSGRRIYQRIITWILNKIVKTFQIVVFVVLAFLLTGQYIVSVFSMILFLFVTDFVTLSLATDTVRYSESPDAWDIGALVKVAVPLGLVIVAESLGLLALGDRLFGLLADGPSLQTFTFDYLVFLGVLQVLVLRERKHFWASRPSTAMTIVVGLDILVVAAISFLGFVQLRAIPPVEILTVLAYASGTSFLVNDVLKTVLVRKYWPWA